MKSILQEKLVKAVEAHSLVEKLSVDVVEETSLARLVELGFANRAENVKLLRQSDHNMETVSYQIMINPSS